MENMILTSIPDISYHLGYIQSSFLSCVEENLQWSSRFAGAFVHYLLTWTISWLAGSWIADQASQLELTEVRWL